MRRRAWRIGRGAAALLLSVGLHGRGDTMQAWTRVKADLDRMIAAGECRR